LAPKPLSARQKRFARIRGDIHPLAPHKVHRPDAVVTDEFISSKKDKRIIKHSTFISKIQKTHKKPLKRRRPSKKLVTTLESLADALPELNTETNGNIEQLREGKVRHRSLKSKPGALKRKEMIVKGEMERFGVSMARLVSIEETREARGTMLSGGSDRGGPGGEKNSAVQESSMPAAATTNRWAALRNYISSTMEQNPAFVAPKS
jgi:Ribosome biogenesis protein SLX9